MCGMDKPVNMENSSNSMENSRDWPNTYNMRTLNLLNFPTSSNRVNYRTVMNRARLGIVTSTAKSLNILRQTLQNSINKDINNIMQKYIDNYFRPSINNLKKNFGNNSVSDQHLQAVCRQILEEAKKMYTGPNSGTITAANSPYNSELAENGSDNENKDTMQTSGKRKAHTECDSDSESISLNNSHLKAASVKKKKLKSSPLVGKVVNKVRASGKMQSKGTGLDSVRREGPKWDSNRLTTETKFVLGSKANKALGFGATRGRLYTKHADIFRYIGDQEDKQWLHEHGLMPPAGGRAYLIIKEDIEDLLKSDEYKDAPGVEAESMGAGFTVPINMIEKMKRIMEAMRNGSVGGGSSDGKSNKLAEDKESLSPRPASLGTTNNALNDNPFVADSTIDNTIDSDQPSVHTNRPESTALSPTDDLDYLNSSGAPSANPSPFSLIASNLSPSTDKSALSPLQPELNSALNDI